MIAVAPVVEKEKNPFSGKPADRTAFGSHDWFILLLLLAGSLVTLTGGLLMVSRSSNIANLSYGLFFIVVGMGMTGFVSSVAIGVVYYVRDNAVNQCLLLAKELRISLNPEQAVELQRKDIAGKVFGEFVEKFVTQDKLAIPLETLFVATGGKRTSASCRQLVLFLHNNKDNSAVVRVVS